jgi:hypothetical protein
MDAFLRTEWQGREARGWDMLIGPWLFPKPTLEPTTQRLHFASYEKRTGAFAVHRIDTERGPVERIWDTRWAPGWTSFVSLQHLLDSRFFAYRADTGQVEVHEVQADGRGLHEIWRGRSKRGWTTLMPFLIGTRRHFLAYNSTSGAVAINRVADDGQGFQEIWSDVWTSGWSSFTPFVLANRPCYLAYKAATGEVNLDRIRADGRGIVGTLLGDTWPSGWASVVPRISGTAVTLLAAPAGSGAADIERIDPDGRAAKQIWQSDITPGWTSVLPAFAHGAKLLFVAHDRQTRQLWLKRWLTSFRVDIRPLFRDSDVEEMRDQPDFPLDLNSYDDVKANAGPIDFALKWQGRSRMPCDAKWPDPWIALFQEWEVEGMLP